VRGETEALQKQLLRKKWEAEALREQLQRKERELKSLDDDGDNGDD
jgi:hypothetical protein